MQQQNQNPPQDNTEELVKEGKAIAESKAAEANPLDIHAQMFFLYTPRLLNMLKLMSKKALVRLVFSLIQHPLNEKELSTRTKLEQDIFQISDQMLTSKYMMLFMTGLEEIQKQEKEKSVENSTESVVQSNISSDITNE